MGFSASVIEGFRVREPGRVRGRGKELPGGFAGRRGLAFGLLLFGGEDGVDEIDEGATAFEGDGGADEDFRQAFAPL